MADGVRRFAVQFPCVRMRENLGGERAIVITATQPPGAEMALATCMDALGRLHANVPFTMAALQYAFQHSKITLVEQEGSGIVAAESRLVGLDGRKLGG